MRPPNHHRCLRQLVTWVVRPGHGGNSLPLCRFFKPPSLLSPIWVSPSHTRARFSGQLLVELMGFYSQHCRFKMSCRQQLTHLHVGRNREAEY